jgi:NitT/TauT family transport system substrate-binding protein
VNVGYSPATASLPLYVATDRGYFQEEGLEVELIPFTTVGDQYPALASGQIDFAGASPDPALFNAIARGVDSKIVAYYGGSSPSGRGMGLLVRQDLIDSGRYRELTDLKGMEIGIITPTSSAAMYFEMILTPVGLTLDDVNLVTLPFAETNVALINKRLDGAVQIQPFALQLESQGVAKLLVSMGQVAPGYPSILLLMGPGFARSQPAAAKRFLLAFLRGQRDVYNTFDKGTGSKEEMYQLLTKYTPIKDPALHTALAEAGSFSSIVPNGEVPLVPLEVHQEFFLRRGAQQERVDLARAVDASYGEYAVQQLGRLPTD